MGKKNNSLVQKITDAIAGVTATAETLPTFKVNTEGDNTNVGMVLFDDDSIQEITRLSGPLAKANEYQVHYWSLVLRRTFSDGTIFDLCIPTIFFNYPQEVSGGNIEFELKDVEETSDTIGPLQDQVAADLLAELKEKIPEFDQFKPVSSGLNSIHRHPGGSSQSFSGTDLNTNVNSDIGVVFPLATGNVRPNFASILYHKTSAYSYNSYFSDDDDDFGKGTGLAHTEYRLATGNAREAEGITYSKGRCITYVKSYEEVGEAERKFGVSNSYIVKDGIKNISSYVQDIMKAWNTVEFKPHLFVEEQHLTQAVVRTSTYTYGGGYNYYKGTYYNGTTGKTTSTKKGKGKGKNTKNSTDECKFHQHYSKPERYNYHTPEEASVTLLSVYKEDELNNMTAFALKLHMLDLENAIYGEPLSANESPLAIAIDDVLDHQETYKLEVLSQVQD